jgi:hypothetical protein
MKQIKTRKEPRMNLNTTSTEGQELPLAAAAATGIEGLPLITLAERLNAEHRAAKSSARSALDHAHAAGLLLIEAKRQVGHGGWGDWLKGNFEGSERTAQVYLRVAGRWAELESKAQRVADLPLRHAVALLAAPTEGPAKSALPTPSDISSLLPPDGCLLLFYQADAPPGSALTVWVVPHVDKDYMFVTWTEFDVDGNMYLVGDTRGCRRDFAA